MNFCCEMIGAYPDTPAELIVSGLNNTDDAMVSGLNQFLKTRDQTDTSLMGHVVAAGRWLEDNGVPPAVALPQPAKKLKVKKTRKTKEIDQADDTPKKKMRTASDVIKRIQWQKELRSEDFTVGYLDRFLGVQEKEFGAFSWDDIASVDDYTVLAIPKHRIQYFKHCGKLIWDKASRLDNVFGSTGSGITLSSFIADSNTSNAQDSCGQQAENVCIPGNEGHSSSEEYSEDDDDGVVVTVASSEKTKSVPCSTAKLECPVMPPLPQQKRRRPNYFVCQRITDPAIMKGVEEVQSKIMKAAPAFSACFVDPASLHVTFCTLALDNESQVKYCTGSLDCYLTDIGLKVTVFNVIGYTWL